MPRLSLTETFQDEHGESLVKIIFIDATKLSKYFYSVGRTVTKNLSFLVAVMIGSEFCMDE